MFYGVLPGFAYADDFTWIPSLSSDLGLIVYNGQKSTFYPFNSVDSSDYSFVSYGFLRGGAFVIYSPFWGDSIDVKNIPLSISHSGLNLQDLSFSFPFDFQLYRLNNNSSSDSQDVSLVPVVAKFEGSATVTFSDGSTSSIPLSSYNSISFSAKKDNRTNMFNLTSDNAFTLTSKDNATLEGVLSHSGGSIDAPVSGQVSGTAQLPDELKADIHAGGTASFSTRGYSSVIKSLYTPSGGQHFQTDNQIEIQQNSTGMPIGVHYFNIYASKLAISMLNGTLDVRDASIYFGASQAISLTASLVDAKVDSLSVTSAKASAVGTLTAPNSSVDSVVQISRHEPFITVTGFSVTGRFSFKRVITSDYSAFSIPIYPPNWNSGLFFTNIYSFGDSFNSLASISSGVHSILYFLRYELPLEIRHLVIPTQEEVKDVVDDAVDEIKNNAGGLGEAMDIVDTSFDTVTNAFTNSSASGFVLPALDVNINGTVYRIWEDYDFGPALRSQPVQQLTTFATTFLQALMVLYLINHLHVMWIALTSGCSYAGMLKLLKFEDDLERKG